MTPELADKIMTRIIARVEADGGVLHKSSGIEEIIGTCAVAESEGEIIDVISYDEAKGQWVHKDGTPLDIGATGPAGTPGPIGVDMGDDRVEPAEPPDGATVSTPDGLLVRAGGQWIPANSYLRAYWDGLQKANQAHTSSFLGSLVSAGAQKINP